MTTSDNLAADLLPDAETIGRRLVERLTSIPGYGAVLGLLISTLCTRIDRADNAAVWELWRLAQGLHYGGAFSAGNLERLKLQLNMLRPKWYQQ